MGAGEFKKVKMLDGDQVRGRYIFEIVLLREASKRKGVSLSGSMRKENFGVEVDAILYNFKSQMLGPRWQLSSRIKFI